MLYALLVQSANDAALAIGKYVSGSVDAFVQLMNEKAKEIGATNTNFSNPNGLHVDTHVSTAHDLAMIAQYAMHNETFRHYVNTVTHTIEPTNIKTEPRYLKNTNKLLFSSEKIDLDGKAIPAKYEYASGVKTGYTSQAQNCLVSFAEKNDQRLIAVVMKSNGNYVYSDTHKLLDYGFDNFRNTTIAYANEFIDNIKISKGLQPVVAGVLDKTIVYPLLNGNISEIERKVTFNESLEAPINKGAVLGKVEYLLDGETIGESNIISTMNVELDPMTKTYNKILSKWYLFVFALIVILRIMVLKNRKRKRRSKRSSYIPYV
jgi:D-alanyl-D-alanine carboxypeptidase (penicillin-binding protein 5/6)